jgi:hypothetical protein
MSPALDHDATSKMVLDLVRIGPPAEYRSATDIVSPIVNIYDVKQNVTLGAQTPLIPMYFDSWLFETLFVIDSHRGVLDGWDGYTAQAPTKTALDTAEMLAAYFALCDEERRPTLCIDVFGRPTFATNVAGFYIHLTVGDTGALTWYAVSDGEEHFADEVAFNGRRLPEALGSLLSLNL